MSPIRLRLKEVRQARGMTQLELAERAEVRRATVSDLERRTPKLLDLAMLERLADALGVDATVLLVTERPAKRRGK